MVDGTLSQMESIRRKALIMKGKMGLTFSPVGVKFILSKTERNLGVCQKPQGYRYCQAVMNARQGKHVYLDVGGISCPAAAAAFGFRPLPEGLKNGKGLQGFGIVVEEETGRNMFEGMTTLEQGKLEALCLFPLEQATMEPDVVVVEDEVEKLM